MKVLILNNSTQAEIFLYGYIGFEVTAGDFLKTLRDLESKFPEITLRINSGGGEMLQGFPIYNAIKQSKSKINVSIDGFAASMASVIMLAGKKISIASNARIMIHAPQAGDYTTVENLENLINLMKSLRGDMAKIYSERIGKSEQWIMDNWLTDGKDHWFTAQEAKDAGLVDEIYNVNGESPSSSWELPKIAAFYNEQLSLSNNQSQKTNEPSMKKIIAVLTGSKLVNVPETATEEVVAESTQALVNQLSAKDQAIAQKDAEITRLTNELKEHKTAGLKKNAETIVDAAVAAGKIVAAQKEGFIKLASVNEEGYEQVKTVLDSMKPYMSVNSQLNNGGAPSGSGTPVTYASLSDEFEKRAIDNSLETLKKENFEHFKAVFKAGTGKDFKG